MDYFFTGPQIPEGFDSSDMVAERDSDHMAGCSESDLAVCVRFDGAGVSAEHPHRGGAGAIAWAISHG
eukprot:6736222-Alexandrium_andersonii.AAC.1